MRRPFQRLIQTAGSLLFPSTPKPPKRRLWKESTTQEPTTEPRRLSTKRKQQRLKNKRARASRKKNRRYRATGGRK